MINLLAQPLDLPCGASLPNRIAKSAMTEGLADPSDQATERHQRLYRRWSRGGAGLLITGNVMIDRRFLERPGNVVIEDDRGRAQLEAWARAGTEAGNQLWMQISHPGRQATRMSSREPLSPSDVQLKWAGMFARPRAMSEEEIQDAIRRFARAASIARESGFTGVQIHGAHGYLLSQFLSPITNLRRDLWGGSLENRARMLLEVVRAVRDAVGDDFPVAVKLNSADFQKGGFSLDECIQVARWLGEARIDLLEISGGSYEQPRLLDFQGDPDTYVEPRRESTREREAYFLEYAAAIQQSARVPLMITGGFRSRDAMLEALDSGDLDVIGLARPLCVEPDLPAKLIEGTIESAPSYEKSILLRGRWTGPASPLTLFKTINVQGEMGWFYQQIVNLAEDREPDRSLGLLRALGRHLRREMGVVRARDRA